MAGTPFHKEMLIAYALIVIKHTLFTNDTIYKPVVLLLLIIILFICNTLGVIYYDYHSDKKFATS